MSVIRPIFNRSLRVEQLLVGLVKCMMNRFARQVVDRFTTFAKIRNSNPTPGQQGVELTNEDVTGQLVAIR